MRLYKGIIGKIFLKQDYSMELHSTELRSMELYSNLNLHSRSTISSRKKMVKKRVLWKRKFGFNLRSHKVVINVRI